MQQKSILKGAIKRIILAQKQFICLGVGINLTLIPLLLFAKTVSLSLQNVTPQTVPSGAGFVLKAPEGQTLEYCSDLYPGTSYPNWDNTSRPGWLDPGETATDRAVKMNPVEYGQQSNMTCTLQGANIQSLKVSFQLTLTKSGSDAPNCSGGHNCLCIRTTNCNQLQAVMLNNNPGFTIMIGYKLPSSGSCMSAPQCYAVDD